MLVSLGVFMVVVHLTTLLRTGKTTSRSADEPQVITGLDEPSADLQQVIERSIEPVSYTHLAEARVKINLRSHHVGHQVALAVHDGGSRLVAGRF